MNVPGDDIHSLLAKQAAIMEKLYELAYPDQMEPLIIGEMRLLASSPVVNPEIRREAQEEIRVYEGILGLPH